MYIKFIFLISAFVLSVLGQDNATHRKFPDNFVFGAANSAYQTEGGWNADDKGENIWDYLSHTTDIITDGSTADVSCDSYHLYARDVEMLKELGVDFYRFSLSWSRILPTGLDNKISAAGLAYYNKLIDLLIENNIRPVISLYHWDLPQPLQNLGGWTNPMLEKYFTDYAKVVFEAFGDRVKEWITFNEPYEICVEGYGGSAKAPAVNMPGIAEYLCAHTLIKAHARSYHLYDDVYRPIQNGRIGWTLSEGWGEPETDSAEDIEATLRVLQFEADFNRYIIAEGFLAHFPNIPLFIEYFFIVSLALRVAVEEGNRRCWEEMGWYAHPVHSEEGDYPAVLKERIAQRSKEQGYSTSRLPSFTPEEIEYIKGTSDFFGLNHYTTNIMRAANATDVFPSPSFEDDLGVIAYQRDDWPGSASAWLKVVPWGFRKLLTYIKEEYNNPEIIIFENGFSTKGGTSDPDRVSYYHQYLNAMLDAMEEGADISGYTAWSLMDNFGLPSGYSVKFGLYEVDFNSPNRTRTARDCAKYYSEVIRTKTIERDV